jgi:hypothetical protein
MRLAVQFQAAKSPLYVTEKLPYGQLPHVLWRWLVGMSAFCQKKRKEKEKEKEHGLQKGSNLVG